MRIWTSCPLLVYHIHEGFAIILLSESQGQTVQDGLQGQQKLRHCVGFCKTCKIQFTAYDLYTECMLTYSLNFSLQVAESTGVVDPEELFHFATTTWAPEVLRLYHPSSNIIAEYLTGLLAKIQHLEVYEVCCRYLCLGCLQQSSLLHLSVCNLYMQGLQ